MVDVQTVTIVIAGISVVIGVINSIRSSREAKQQRQTEIQTRQAELFMNIYARFQDQEFTKTMYRIETEYRWTDFDEFFEKYGFDERTWTYPNLEVYAEINSVARYFEGVGVLVKEGLIDIIFVYELLMQMTKIFWEYFGPIMILWRIRIGDPKIYDCVEYLYDRIKRIDEPEYPDVVRARVRELAKPFFEKDPRRFIRHWEQRGSTDEARRQYVIDMSRDPQLADIIKQLYHEFKQQQATVNT